VSKMSKQTGCVRGPALKNDQKGALAGKGDHGESQLEREGRDSSSMKKRKRKYSCVSKCARTSAGESSQFTPEEGHGVAGV